jgi:carbon-monoxide dehydrogenase small subunit
MRRGGELSAVQRAFMEHGGVQCGYCTPGLIMNATALLDENPEPTAEDVRFAIGGNLCRCTGYTKVTEAILCAADLVRAERGPSVGTSGAGGGK